MTTNNEKAYLQDLQKQKDERRGPQVVPAQSSVIASAKPREMFNLQAFMANNPSREEVLETCCAFANDNLLGDNRQLYLDDVRNPVGFARGRVFQ